ncbi:MAG: DUF421 domain-containing protein [Kofleriaceae bacterium]
MFFDSWSGLLRVLVVGPCLYVALVLMLRVSGKRTLAKMNAFDLIVTVAMGSMLASTTTSKDVALVEGLVAMALLIALQFVIAWSASRSRLVDRLVKARPTMVLYRGAYLDDEMRRERVSPNEVVAAARAAGMRSLDDVVAVVLETSGEFTVIPRGTGDDAAHLLENVRAPELRLLRRDAG